MKPRTNISKVVLDALIELEAESVASKLGVPIELAREGVRDLCDEGDLDVRSIAPGKYILFRRGRKATWLQSVSGFDAYCTITQGTCEVLPSAAPGRFPHATAPPEWHNCTE